MYNLHRLGEYIEMETGRQNSYELFCQGSEEYEGDKRSINFAFASPPYFSLEMYGVDGGDFNNAEQCWQKFPELEEWLEGYVRPTIKNLYRVLKRFSAYAVNIADFKIGNTQVNYVDEWKRISIEEGFTFEKNLYLGARARTGSALLSASVPGMGDLGSMKTENIMVFSK
jgi:DNA modification methylase